ncbi:carbohydrate-binding module family 20 domain-containing protein [Streptomyces sp. NPDC008121]|uniref:carbohydrate-binding module family 20 domain-containing protein n=1 Tax=Streptomyces sp. NPDC008121 TaxID=3364809 RepID=UPI0036E99CB3
MQFSVEAQTQWGDTVFVVGDAPDLGAWDPSKAVPLDPAQYPVWSASVSLPARQPVDFKYLIKSPNGSVRWEEGENRKLTPPREGVAFTTHDAFRLSPHEPSPGIAPSCVYVAWSWRYVSTTNNCTGLLSLQILYDTGEASSCRMVAPNETVTFSGIGMGSAVSYVVAAAVCGAQSATPSAPHDGMEGPGHAAALPAAVRS